MGHDHVHLVLEQWREELPDLDRSAFGVVGRIARVQDLLQAEIEPIFVRHGVSGGEFDVLAALRRAGRPYRLTPTALSRALLVTSGGMTKRLLALERRGLIRREDDPHDGRSRAVTLTPAGRRVAEAAVRDVTESEERLLQRLDRGREDLATLLERLAVALGDESGAGPGSQRP